MRNLRMFLAVSAVLACVTAGCSSEAITARGEATGGHTSASTTAATYEGNPGDILALSNFGTTENVLHYDNYPQMRDFSDSVVLARFRNLDTVVEPSSDATLSGVSLLSFDVIEIIGGRESPQLTDGELVVTLPLDGERAARGAVLERLNRLKGKATYLLFLRRATPNPEVHGPAYVPNIDNGPPGILAVWPGDGRLSPIGAPNDLAAAAIKHGEELTGTSTLNPIDNGPVFDGDAPIGLTVQELRQDFAQPVGSVTTDAPANWDDYVRVATAAGAYR